jgi:hypothetical protein
MPAGDMGPSIRIRVRGSARLDAHAARAAGRLVLSGTVVDDAARPVARVPVALAVSISSQPQGAAADPIQLTGAAPEPCGEGRARPILERADRIVLQTDDAARFCVRLALPTNRYVAHFEARAAELAGSLVDGAALDLPVDLALEAVSLRFDPERPVLSLDEESAALDVIASADDDGVTTPAAGLPLVLSNENGTVLGTATTDAAGRVRFVMPGAMLGTPGPGELRVLFAGTAGAGASSHTMPVERRTRIDLAAPDAPERRLPVGSPEDGVAVNVIAAPRCAKPHGTAAGCKALPTGTIEVLAEEGSSEATVGAAPLEGARARVVATFPLPAATPSGADVPLRVRYVPDAPWYQPGAELDLLQPVRVPGGWNKFPLLLAGVGVTAWLVLARFPSTGRAARRATNRAKAGASAPTAEVALLQAGPPEAGWSGLVVDAHEGFGVVGARVTVERRGFERVDTLAQTATDGRGAFALPTLHTRPGDELVAEGPLHAGIRRALPPPGELKVQLVLRRRALLERLIVWARRRGKPFDARPEPTPGHVRRAATSDFAVARWADAVERAAFGGAVVDRNTELEIDRLAPPEAPAEPPQDRPSPPEGAPRPRRG